MIGLARASQAFYFWKSRYWFRTFLICISDMVKCQFGLFLFLRTWKYPSSSCKEENCLRCQFTMRILYLTMRLWDSGQSCESSNPPPFGFFFGIALFGFRLEDPNCSRAKQNKRSNGNRRKGKKEIHNTKRLRN